MPSLSAQTLLRRFAASGASKDELNALKKALGIADPHKPKRSKAGKPPINGETMVVKTITVSLPPVIAEWIETQPNKSAIARAGIEQQYRESQNG